MTDLKFATDSEIKAELALRRALADEAVVASRMGKIISLFEQGKIAKIAVDECNIGTSVVTTKYYIHLK